MKKIISILTLAAAVVLLLNACTKATIEPTTLKTNSNTAKTVDPGQSTALVNTSPPVALVTYTPYYHQISNISNCLYYNQFDAGCTNSTYKNYGCGPAVCLMGAHTMSTSIPVTAAKFTTYCAGMGTTSSGTSLSNCYNYLHTNVFGSQYAPDVISSQSTAITKVKTYISSDHPIIALVRYNGASMSPSKVVSPTGNINHFVLIVALNETSLGAGTVYYIDPNNNAGYKSVSWATFLSAMTAATGTNYNYQFMRIGN